MWLDVAEAPLAFFRLAPVRILDSITQTVTLLVFRVAGLFLLLLPLLAVRRVVRLE